MDFSPAYWTTVVGSFPHLDGNILCQKLVSSLDVPDWPQLTRRSFRENMYVQYSASMPAITIDEENERVFFDTNQDLPSALEEFYTRYLADDFDAFSLRAEYAPGFYTMLETLRGTPGSWAKGQVTGPISFGLTVTDQGLRASLYNELLADTIVKNMAMNARWQVQQLKKVRPNVFIFVDEPYMASYGSAFISLSRDQVASMLDEVFSAIHSEGALAGVHCCGNTDWSVLMATQVDILNLDAYGFLENLALYPAELRAFLDRGGVLAWGLVPNNELVFRVTAQELAQRLRDGLKLIGEKAAARGVRITPDDFGSRSLVAPSCGLGSASIAVADQVLETLVRTGELLQRG